MLRKIKHAKNYLLYAVFSNIIFGFIYYLVFSQLVKHSLLAAYLGCLALIFIGLYLDKFLLRDILSAKTIAQIKHLTVTDQKKNYHLIQTILNSFVSFKTILFVFYFLILVASQVLNIAPSLANETISNFITANSYGMVLLLAFDRIVGQFSKDRKMTKEKSELFKATMNENDKKLENKT